MTDADGEVLKFPVMPDIHLRELAISGAICVRCGGIHCMNCSIAILADAADLPFCECPGCPLCERFREAVATLVALHPEGTDDTTK